MKIFIVYACAGAGHLKAAEALYDCLKEKRPEFKLELVDILESANPLLRFLYRDGYSFLVRYLTFLWYFLFAVTGTSLSRRLFRKPLLWINRLFTGNFIEELTRENPDCILSTHFLTSEIAAFLKRSGKISSKLITVITDFGVHPYWVSGGTDLYVVASDATRDLLLKEGVEEEKIRDFGIPVANKFLAGYDRNSLAQELGIDNRQFCVLLMTGSFGIGPLEDISACLSRYVQVLVVCANNRRLFNRLKTKNLKNVKVYGFVEDVQKLMAVSDMIITKPGGLSIAEVLVMELVPVFISAIPGQEAENARILHEYGIGTVAKRTEEIKEMVLDLKDNPARLQEIKSRIKPIRRPDAAKRIIDAIC